MKGTLNGLQLITSQESMDQYLHRLRQELLSMKEFGEGLQEQMTCMMGALQELKLLQLQAALEQLDISGEQNQLRSMRVGYYYESLQEAPEVRNQCNRQAEKLLPGGRSLDNSSLVDSRGSWAASSPSSVSSPNVGQQVLSAKRRETEIDHRSSFLLPSVENKPISRPNDTSSVLQKLNDFNCPHFDQELCSYESTYDDTNDWTSPLMSQSRNRQPLVLGDNIFADLVGNWLDLPDMEKKGEKNESLPNVSRSQEIYKKLTLTANFFKKFLRTVRPDRDKLLKEKPGWLQFDYQTSHISKRSKKASKQKSAFYYPSQTDLKSRVDYLSKTTMKSTINKTCAKKNQGQEDTIYTDFDMDTAVWV
ncbi:PAK4-inhibitor INKA2 [Hyperolius riggenbachi]|uniref:PAK4-inhibitor INKA2 n=1 Tax=Hyperolius riggenbachi TaxID=752182 RepID=UPI0035A2AD93